MAAVPVIINGVLMPKGRKATDVPIPGVFVGYATIAGLEVGGGPIIPEDGTTPPDPPVDPPINPPPNLAVVIKPAPATGGWGLASQGGAWQWFFAPGAGDAEPKR